MSFSCPFPPRSFLDENQQCGQLKVGKNKRWVASLYVRSIVLICLGIVVLSLGRATSRTPWPIYSPCLRGASGGVQAGNGCLNNGKNGLARFNAKVQYL